MNIERFEYFLQVAQTGSITLAARRCYITQTAMSQQMAALEKELGLTLLTRGREGTTLTADGRALIPLAERLTADYRQIQDFASVRKAAARQLTIAYTGPMEQQLILHALPAFSKMHPDVQVRVRQVAMSDIGSTLAEEACDIALAMPGEVCMPGARESLIVERPVCAVLSVQHPLANRDRLTLTELQHQPIVLLQANASVSASGEIAKWLVRLGWREDELRYDDTIEDQLLMVNLNQGISLMPQGSYPSGVRCVPLTGEPVLKHRTMAFTRQTSALYTQLIHLLRSAGSEKTEKSAE